MVRRLSTKLFQREYATFRDPLITYFREEALPNAVTFLDPMAGTAPLIPHIEEMSRSRGITTFAHFNDILPHHMHINRAKTYKVCRAVRRCHEDDPQYLESQLLMYLAPLRKKSVLPSNDMVHEDVLRILNEAWYQAADNPEPLCHFFRAVILLCVRPYSCISSGKTNYTWTRSGGITTHIPLNVNVRNAISKLLEFYDLFYKKMKGPSVTRFRFTSLDAVKLKSDELFDTVVTSPPYQNRTDYRRIHAPELYFLSQLGALHDRDLLDKSILGTIKVRDYTDFDLDLEVLSRVSPSISRFIATISRKQPEKKNENYYYPKGFARFYRDLFKAYDNVLSLLAPHATLYIGVQNNIHRGTVNTMADFLVEYFTLKGYKAKTDRVWQVNHQGKRNISSEYPLVLDKHLESIVKVCT